MLYRRMIDYCMNRRVPSLLITLLVALPAIANEEPSIISQDGLAMLSLDLRDVPDVHVWTDYGAPFDSFYGVIAYSNGRRSSPRYYQCTELVHRFVREVYGIPTMLGMGLGHGKDLARGIAVHFADTEGSSGLIAPYQITLRYFANGESTVLPTAGSIVSLLIGRHGHVGIIRSITPISTDRSEATLFAQHGGMRSEVGTTFKPEKIIFTRDSRGRWHGTWQVNSTRFDAVGWTIPIVTGQSEPETATFHLQ